MLVYLSGLSSFLVAYMMVCRLNERRRHILSFEGWAYLMLFGGALYSFLSAFNGFVPSVGRVMLDCGLLVYFSSRSYRGRKWLVRHG